MRLLTTVLVSSISLCACGGGGSSSSTSTPSSGSSTSSTPTFPLKKGMVSNIASGIQFTGSITTKSNNGSCLGSGTLTRGKTIGGIFLNKSVLTATGLLNISLINCNVPTIPQSNEYYYDTNYNLLGQKDLSTGEVSVWEGTPNIPTTVQVGDVINVGKMNDYSDSTLKYKTGYSQMTMVIFSDTSSTAIVNKAMKSYDAQGILKISVSENSRIDLNGNISFISLDAQNAAYPYLSITFRR